MKKTSLFVLLLLLSLAGRAFNFHFDNYSNTAVNVSLAVLPAGTSCVNMVTGAPVTVAAGTSVDIDETNACWGSTNVTGYDMIAVGLADPCGGFATIYSISSCVIVGTPNANYWKTDCPATYGTLITNSCSLSASSGTGSAY